MIDLNLGDTQIILRECHRRSLTVQQTAYVMATAYWETARTVKPVKEAYWVKGAEKWRKENLRYYPWYGRGYVQLTWEANYIKAGKKLGMDLTTNPDAVMEPNVSAKILVLGSLEGWFTGKKLGDYINKSRADYKGARRIINGTDRAADIAEIAKDYEKAIAAKPYQEPKPALPAWLRRFLGRF